MGSLRMDEHVEDSVDRYENNQGVDVGPSRVTLGSPNEESTHAR